MPCQPEEEFAQGPESPHPVTPTKSTRNDGVGNADPDAENSESSSDLNEKLPQKRKRSRTILKYEVVKRWTTGERAEKDDEVIQNLNELREEACKLMELSGQRKFPCHKSLDTDLGLGG